MKKKTVETLSDPELINVIAGKPVGGDIIHVYGGLGRFIKATMFQLEELVSSNSAYRLASALELSRRMTWHATAPVTEKFEDSQSVARWGTAKLGALDHEELWCLSLDGHHGLRNRRMIASGGIHGLHISVRDVLRNVLKDAASAFILVHNHPSGDPDPSTEDMEFTKAIAEGSKTIGTAFVDHVVVARSRWKSMAKMGLIG